jgi:recombination protein RecT
MNNKQELIKAKENTKRQLNAMPIGGFMNQTAIKNRITSMMGSERGLRFITGVTSAVSTNPALAECTNESIFNGALLGETLNLSPSPQLGQYYLVPYKKYKKNTKEVESVTAQFQLGYKGYIQLAIRSGQYKKINVVDVKEGEFIEYNMFDEEYKFNPIQNYEERKNAKTIGYYAMFEYLNGFKKSLYMTKEEMLDHANTYSSAFDRNKYQDLLDGKIPEKDMWKYSSFWYKNFDEMAKKTMLRQLISKWGVMSIEMQKAFESDMAEIKENGVPEYIDNQPDEIIPQDDEVSDAEFDEKTNEEETKEIKQVGINEL